MNDTITHRGVLAGARVVVGVPAASPLSGALGARWAAEAMST